MCVALDFWKCFLSLYISIAIPGYVGIDVGLWSRSRWTPPPAGQREELENDTIQETICSRLENRSTNAQAHNFYKPVKTWGGGEIDVSVYEFNLQEIPKIIMQLCQFQPQVFFFSICAWIPLQVTKQQCFAQLTPRPTQF